MEEIEEETFNTALNNIYITHYKNNVVDTENSKVNLEDRIIQKLTGIMKVLSLVIDKIFVLTSVLF